MSDEEDVLTEVSFNVITVEDGGLYGVTLYVDDDQDNDEVPCWRTTLRGKPGADVDEVSELYADCHQNAMEEGGMEGMMSPDEWLEKMRASVVRAGELMAHFGYHMVPAGEVTKAQAAKLFEGSDWPEAPAVDIRKMN